MGASPTKPEPFKDYKSTPLTTDKNFKLWRQEVPSPLKHTRSFAFIPRTAPLPYLIVYPFEGFTLYSFDFDDKYFLFLAGQWES